MCEIRRRSRRPVAFALALAAAVAVVAAGGAEAPVAPVPFSRAVQRGVLPLGWSLFDFPSVERRTGYRLTAHEGPPSVLAAHSRDAAALLWSPVDEPHADATTLRWRWKVDRTLDGSDLSVVRRDDAAARVYVGFAYRPELVGPWQRLRYRLAAVHHGEMPPYAALIYTWAHAEAVGDRFSSPHFERAITVVLRNADDPAGEWAEEARDVRADFRDWFGFDPPPVSHLAVMTDTDDTHGEATAWYGDLVLD